MLFSINFHAELKKYEQFYHKKQETALNMDMFVLTPTLPWRVQDNIYVN